jgi:hypothetical protein
MVSLLLGLEPVIQLGDLTVLRKGRLAFSSHLIRPTFVFSGTNVAVRRRHTLMMLIDQVRQLTFPQLLALAA